jgi:hypothetical protein
MRLELEYLVQLKSSLSGDTHAAFQKVTDVLGPVPGVDVMAKRPQGWVGEV